MELSELRDSAETALLAAGRVALRHFRRPMAVHDKDRGSGFDPVTAADRDVEMSLRQALRAAWPALGIVGEEHAEIPGSSEFSWIIDPIDGTRAFISGMPLWGILLGLLQAGRPVLGFMHQPYLHELFGGDGSCAWLSRGGERISLRTRPAASLATAILYTTHPDHFACAEDAARHARLARRVRLSRYGGDCYSYCMLAAGHVDLVVESGLSDYDILPLVPIIEGAGGVVTDWQGRPLAGGGRIIAAAGNALHAEALALLTE